MPAKKKTVTRKKAAKKAARKTAKQASAKKSTVATKPAEGAVESASIEDRFLTPLAELEKIVGQFRRMPWGGLDLSRFAGLGSLLEGRMETAFPSMDIVNREKEILVRAEVPGFEKDDIAVALTDRTLTIKGESRHEEEAEEGDVHRHEIRTGSFSRVVTLPEDVDGRKAKATCKDGILELTLPKSRKAKKHSITLE